ncbi:transmembrane protein 234 homolog [Condylostylus longicornis]|uniref:transmembrane protein 234 homolog n=1 Tax=Condylostylus longicornis TaxID=2530218 RepID=UPI00244DA26F|nr:transmembrane protein 234 homolog [Condylostylus longicornis]
MIYHILSLISVGLLWGATNPFLKKGSKGIENIKAKTKLQKFSQEIQFLLKNPSNSIPLLLNQSGSLIYVLTLQNANLTMAVPIANALSFVFTAFAGYFLGEIHSKNTLFGSLLVIIGSSLLIYDKI